MVSDCADHSRLTRHYSIAQLQAALNSMPSTIAEYGNCQTIIQDQIDIQEGKKIPGTHTSGVSGGSSSAVVILVIAVVVVLLLASGGFLYSRRRADGGESEDPPPPST